LARGLVVVAIGLGGLARMFHTESGIVDEGR
jgi:hypothetical protein